ncbi:FG-GAP-like repeat-containing protein [Streptomyces aurantiogriseus]|uniref:FG-GAP-like repeat-containing protein n=1 Tax=Streptomyces aurantiogriseus TaxID=66870 RepID=UPI0016749BEC|nr:FG-GAP-like repeat-containing protein [Streptomyces aurantiogriseus]
MSSESAVALDQAAARQPTTGFAAYDAAAEAGGFGTDGLKIIDVNASAAAVPVTETSPPVVLCGPAGTARPGPASTGALEQTAAGGGSGISIDCVDEPGRVAAMDVADGDIVINYDVEGLDQAVTQDVIDGLNQDDELLSDAIRDMFESHKMDLPDPGFEWFDFDGTLVQTSTGLAIVLPGAQTWEQSEPPLWGPWVAGVIGFALYAFVDAVCIVGFGGASATPLVIDLCGSLAGFAGAFVGTVMLAIFKGDDLSHFNPVWNEALAAGIVAAAGGYMTNRYLVSWAKDKAPAVFSRMGKAIVSAANSIRWWVGDSVVSAATWLSAELTQTGILFHDLIVAAARRLGFIRNMRVMPLGDSITEGRGSSTGSSYRADLWAEFDAAGNRLDFVGTMTAGQLPDRNHEGHSGWRIDQIAQVADCSVPMHRPNVILLHAGTNDMNQNYSVGSAPTRLGNLIDQVLVDAPEAVVVVATVVPSTKPAVQPRIVEYNRSIPGLVKSRQAAGKHVLLADMSSVTTADLADQLHPNDEGYRKMSTVFRDSIYDAAGRGWLKDPVAPDSGGTGTCPAPETEPGGWDNAGEVIPGAGLPVSSGWVDFADINGDGRDDRLRIADDGAVEAWGNEPGDGGKPSWSRLGRIAPGVGAPGAQVYFTDINGDGRADYLDLDPAGPVRAWLNTPGDGGKPSWKSWGEIAPGVGASSHQINLTDINGDRRADYLVVEDSGAVRAWLNTPGDGGKPSWSSWGEIAKVPGVTPGQIRFTDLSGDGRADFLAIDGGGAVRAWLNTPGDGGKPSWKSWGEIAKVPGVTPGQIRFVNLDGDGRSDYLAFKVDGAVDAWLNTPGDGGKPSWSSLGRVYSGELVGDPDALQFAEINGDGFPDYVIVNNNGSVQARLTDGGISPAGTPHWTGPQEIAPGVGAPGSQVRFADIDGDDRADYLVIDDNGAVRAWLNTPGNGGKPSWKSWGEIAPGVGAPGPQVRFADIDGDDRADYLVIDDNGAVRAWLNTPGNGGKPSWAGLGTFAAGVDGATRAMVRFADVSGDGRADYLMVSEAGQIRAWINNGGEGRGGWTNRGVFAVGVGSSRNSLRLADINRDDRADYLVVSGDGSVRAWLNAGGDPA